MSNTLSAEDQETLNKGFMGRLISWANFPVYTWTVQVMVIFAGSIYGGMAAFFMFAGSGFNVPQLSLLLIGTVIPNALAIGQVPMKQLIPTFFAAVILNTLVILYNVVMLIQ